MSENKIAIPNDRDKPFILALIASGVTILNITFAAVGALIENKDMTIESIEVMKYTFTLTTMAWSFYFGKPEKSQ